MRVVPAHRLCTALDESTRIVHGLSRIDLVAHERKIRHNVGHTRSPNDGAQMVDHVLHRHRQSGVVPKHNLTQRITHEYEPDASSF